MSIAKATILRRIHTALRDVPHTEHTQAPARRDYRLTDDAPRSALVDQFAERVAEYKATVHVVSEAALAATIATVVQARGIERLVVPGELPAEWLPAGITVLHDEPPLTHAQLDQSQGVITSCALVIAQTGTIILDHGPGQGRRALSLVPDYHLCIVRADQVVGLVPEAIAPMEQAARAGRPLTMISGPSATSDIELNRVEGVHGPRTLEVIIVE